jgi:signal transduction histidine kinase
MTWSGPVAGTVAAVRGLRLRHPYTWGRDHPLVVDTLIALVLLAFGVATEFANDAQASDPNIRDPSAFGVFLVVLGTLPLIFRRRHPLAVYIFVTGVTVTHGAMMFPGGGPTFGMMFALYAVAAHAHTRRTAVFVLVSALVMASALLLTPPSADVGIWDVMIIWLFMVTAWVLGDNMRIRRAYVAAVEERAEQLERDRDLEAQRAVLQERGRIARELHDVVAHHMSVMVVQAGAARRTLARDPDRAAEALTHIETTGRDAMDEMRRLVGVLRTTDEERGSLIPQPGIDEVPVLVDHCREIGLDVQLHTEGTERSLPSGMELVVYRIVQEALTNTMKHAGPASAQVQLNYGATSFSLSVCDDGRGAAAPMNGEAGHGLAGMKERVTLYGGTITAGPRPGGGFRVFAELPLEPSHA